MTLPDYKNIAKKVITGITDEEKGTEVTEKEIEAVIKSVVLMSPVKYNEIRYTVDDHNESLSKKIREATNMKIPVQLIVGPKDKEAREVSVRTQSGEEKIKLTDLANYLKKI